MNNDLDPGGSFEIEKSFADVSADDYDALIIPGGAVGVDDLRADDDAVGLVGEFAEAGQADGRDRSRPSVWLASANSPIKPTASSSARRSSAPTVPPGMIKAS